MSETIQTTEVSWMPDRDGLVTLFPVEQDLESGITSFHPFTHVGHVSSIEDVDALIGPDLLRVGPWTHDPKGTPPYWWANVASIR